MVRTGRGVGFDFDGFAAAAVFDDLYKLIEGQQYGGGWTFTGMFETHRNEAVEVGAGQRDPAVGSTLDFDAL